MTTPSTPNRPRRFEIGQDYRPSQLRPGVMVVRQVSHSTTALSSGSPCCLRTSTIDYKTITINQREYRDRIEGHSPNLPPVFTRRCAGCGSKYWIHLDMKVLAPLIRTIAWEARP